MSPAVGSLHHIEVWVADLARAEESFGRLLGALGYRPFQRWEGGRSWALGSCYLVVEQSPALSSDRHDRLRPGVNHLAFHAGDRAAVDALTADAQAHGWRLMYADRHPYAGGEGVYAAYLENADGFEVELVADAPGEER
ncbi:MULTISPECIES: VOC family protein [unclassified Streptomyces]|uniref:VOC family protein n=1 Tax=unclassified Streptomyces TaxID=2593676 RepID=UPI0016608A22|nr:MULTISPECIES: VOC family protein [unclassified Streptomyces]MBD0712319.1 glyoxalase [Streptomyces sp. CBMA291]MBD0716693.1 glyoxalase [Streptomyces sp. CBMA370]